MPELPEVETVRRGLATVMEGRPVTSVRVNRPDLRVPLPEGFAERISGRMVRNLDRRAKYLLIELDDGTVVIVHLGMSGRMIIDEAGSAPAGRPDGRHEHVIFEVGNGTAVRFADPRRFGLMALGEQATLADHPLLRHLGPEPTDSSFTGPVLEALLAGRNTPIKSALLDQSVVAGLGNIYVCESLFESGVSPRRRAANVRGYRAKRLATAIREVLARAIDAGGSSLRDHVAPSGELGYFQHSFKVYGREGGRCDGCGSGGTIRRIVQSGRSTFYCPACQR